MKLFDCLNLRDLENVLQTVHPDAERETGNPKGRTLLAIICHRLTVGIDRNADKYVELLLRYGADPNDVSNPLGNLLMTQGSFSNSLPGVRLRVLRLLLEYGLDVNNSPYTLLGAVSYDLRFSSQEDQEIISLLVQNGACRTNKIQNNPLGETPLEHARNRLAHKFNNHESYDLSKYNKYLNDPSPGYKNWQTIIRTLDPTSPQMMDMATAKKAAEDKKAKVMPKIKQQRDEAQRKVQLTKQQAEAARQQEIARQEVQKKAELARQAEETRKIAEAAKKAEAERQAKLEAERQSEIKRQAAETARQAELARQEAQKQAKLLEQRQAEEVRMQAEIAKQAALAAEEAAMQAEIARQAKQKSQAEKLTELETQNGFVLLIYGSDGLTEYWYRGDSRTPTKIFTHGFTARGTDMSLVDHVSGESRSGYVSLSTSKEAAMSFPKKASTDIFLYAIRQQTHAVNVETELPRVARNILHPVDIAGYVQGEKERAVPHKVESQDIRGAWRVETYDSTIGEQLQGDYELEDCEFFRKIDESFIPNPEYTEDRLKPFVLPNTQPWKSINTAGKTVTVVGAGLDAFSLNRAYQESQRTGNHSIFFNESARIIGAWTGAVTIGSACAEFGAAIGSFIAPGPGTVIGGGTGALVGGIVGGIAGSIAGYAGGGKIATSPLVLKERLKSAGYHPRGNWKPKPKKNNAYNELIEKIEEDRALKIRAMITSKHKFGSHLAFKIFLQNNKHLDINEFKQKIAIAQSRSKQQPGTTAIGRSTAKLFACSQAGKQPVKTNTSNTKSSGFQRSNRTGLDRRTDQPTLRGLSAESRVGARTGSREQVAGRSGRYGGQGHRTNTGNGTHSASSSKFSTSHSSKGSTIRAKPSNMKTVDKQSSKTTTEHNKNTRPQFNDKKRFSSFIGSSAKKESPSNTVGLDYGQQSHASRPNQSTHHSSDFTNGFFSESKRPNNTGSREQVTVGSGWARGQGQQQKSKTLSADRWRWRQYARGTSQQGHAKLLETLEQDRADKIRAMIDSNCSFGSYAGFGIFLQNNKDLSMEEFAQQIEVEKSNVASKKAAREAEMTRMTINMQAKEADRRFEMSVKQNSHTSTSSKQGNSGQVYGVSSGMGGGGASGSY